MAPFNLKIFTAHHDPLACNQCFPTPFYPKAKSNVKISRPAASAVSPSQASNSTANDCCSAPLNLTFAAHRGPSPAPCDLSHGQCYADAGPLLVGLRSRLLRKILPEEVLGRRTLCSLSRACGRRGAPARSTQGRRPFPCCCVWFSILLIVFIPWVPGIVLLLNIFSATIQNRFALHPYPLRQLYYFVHVIKQIICDSAAFTSHPVWLLPWLHMYVACIATMYGFDEMFRWFRSLIKARHYCETEGRLCGRP